jgi:hypothetical protein
MERASMAGKLLGGLYSSCRLVRYRIHCPQYSILNDCSLHTVKVPKHEIFGSGFLHRPNINTLNNTAFE